MRGRLNILVSRAAPARARPPLLNVLSSYIPADRTHRHHRGRGRTASSTRSTSSAWRARPPNIEGKGEVTIRDLVRNALRMRPDRIIVGEIRGGEALDMLQAMNTGHDGSLSTVHANSPARRSVPPGDHGADGRHGPARSGPSASRCSRALHLIVHQSRMGDGTRRITHITEVQGMEGDIITLQNLFVFDWEAGIDETGHYRGRLKSTGIRPAFLPILRNQGISVLDEVFSFETYDKSYV